MKTLHKQSGIRGLALVMGITAALALNANATPIAFSTASATFSQGGFSPSATINGVTSEFDGWALSPNQNVDQALFVTTTSGQGFAGGSEITFTLYDQFTGAAQESMGKFRFSVTTDATVNGGSTWTQLTPVSAVATGGATLTIQGDNSILASGTNPSTANYTIVADTVLTGITGIRLEALTDPSFAGKSGRAPDGNFVLTELQADIVASAVPEPGTVSALLMGLSGLAGVRFFRRKNVA